MSLAGKVIAITGGGSGIGLATVNLLAQRGATVCVADLDPSAASALLERTCTSDQPHDTARVDVSRRADVDAWIAGVVSRLGRLDGAANTAGVIGRSHSTGTLAQLDDDEWERIVGVNLTGCMYCLRAELRCIADGGSIVNVASVHGTNGTHPRVPGLNP